jgi:hypothetical protein
MVLAKFLRYVAIPTNRRMCFQHVPELIHVNCIPSQQLSFRAEESRPMVHPMNFWKNLAATDAILVAIPSH